MRIFANDVENKTWLCNSSLANNTTSSNKLLFKDRENWVIEAITPEKGVFLYQKCPNGKCKK